MTAIENAVEFSAWTNPDGSVCNVRAWIAEQPRGTSEIMRGLGFSSLKSTVINGKAISRYERPGAMPSHKQVEEMEARIAELRR